MTIHDLPVAPGRSGRPWTRLSPCAGVRTGPAALGRRDPSHWQAVTVPLPLTGVSSSSLLTVTRTRQARPGARWRRTIMISAAALVSYRGAPAARRRAADCQSRSKSY